MAISTIRSHAIRHRLWVRPPIKWIALRAAHRMALASILAGLKKTFIGKRGKRGSTHQMAGAAKQLAGKIIGSRTLETVGRIEKGIGKMQRKAGRASNTVRGLVGNNPSVQSRT